jgi:hypothetical protein
VSKRTIFFLHTINKIRPRLECDFFTIKILLLKHSGPRQAHAKCREALNLSLRDCNQFMALTTLSSSFFLDPSIR